MQPALLNTILPILERTPAVLNAQLRGLPEEWINATDGPGTWSPLIVVGHMIHAEEDDWMPRLKRILQHGTSVPFDPFDREAQFVKSKGKTMDQLLDEFQHIRTNCLSELRALNLHEEHLTCKGLHPALGETTAHELLATWAAHDQAHLVQISRTLARKLKPDIGPWAEFLSVMK
ncbi:MAG: DinB family protein [Terriglobus sp.]